MQAFFSKIKFSKVAIGQYLFVVLLLNIGIWQGNFKWKESENNRSNTNQSRIVKKISMLCWVAYAPTHFNPTKSIYPDSQDIERDLTQLANKGFDGIVTYGSEYSLGLIPQLAKKVGFEGVIMGIWDPQNKGEIHNAVAMNQFVDGYCVGNGGLNKHYNFDQLEKTIKYLKATTCKPVTTTEAVGLYRKVDALLTVGDWVFPDARLYWTPGLYHTPEDFFNQVQEDYAQLVGLTDQPVLIKAVGYPSDGSIEATDEGQAKFFTLLLKNTVLFPYERTRFVYFEAFDQPWKNWHAVESHWGVFDQDRSPKQSATYIWGKEIPMDRRLGFAQELQPGNGRWVYFSVNFILFILFFLFYKKQHNKLEQILTVQPDKHRILFYREGQLKQIIFPKTHDKCVTLLTTFLQLARPLHCGELIYHSGDPLLTEKCLHNDSWETCPEKKQYCQAYKTLSNHRIGSIRKILQTYEIGDIQVIPGESKWQITLCENIKVKILL